MRFFSWTFEAKFLLPYEERYYKSDKKISCLVIFLLQAGDIYVEMNWVLMILAIFAEITTFWMLVWL